MIGRREFITLLGGAAVAWPLAARAQQPAMRRIAVLQGGSDRDDPRARPIVDAFLQTLQQLGWTDGRNVKIDYRWPAGDADKARKYAAELVALAPDVILTIGSANLGPLLQATRAVPIVFYGEFDKACVAWTDGCRNCGRNAGCSNIGVACQTK
jgi:putative tryptophan/tyrosine transport system substrate-binding protein